MVKFYEARIYVNEDEFEVLVDWDGFPCQGTNLSDVIKEAYAWVGESDGEVEAKDINIVEIKTSVLGKLDHFDPSLHGVKE